MPKFLIDVDFFLSTVLTVDDRRVDVDDRRVDYRRVDAQSAARHNTKITVNDRQTTIDHFFIDALSVDEKCFSLKYP